MIVIVPVPVLTVGSLHIVDRDRVAMLDAKHLDVVNCITEWRIHSHKVVGTDMMVYCWVKNEDWLGAKSDLWLKFIEAFIKDDSIALSLPQQEVYVIQDEDAEQKS